MGEWEVRIDDLTDKQREVADLIGFDNYLKLIEYYSADTIYIPKPDSFARIKRNQAIVAEFNGYNYNELAQKYGLTSVMIRNIIREKIRETGRTPQPEQMSLFDPPE